VATKKDMESVTDTVEAAAESVVKEVKKAAKKAAPKAAEAAEAVEKAVKKTAKSAVETAEDAAEAVEKAVKKTAKAAAETAENAAEAVEKAVKKTAKAATETAEKVVEAVTEAAAETVAKAAGAVKEAAAKVEKKADAAAKTAPKKAKGPQADMKKLEGKPRLKQRYQEEIMPSLSAKFAYKNVMQIPYLEKVIINMGLGSDKDNPKGIEAAIKELSTIAGQKAVVTRAKKSVANFKVREGMTIGAKVTLRGDRMYYFVDKLFNIVLPRVRDFRGVSDKSFDGRGNYALGLKEQLIFPEINYDDVDKVRGMNVVFVTSAKSDEECKELLSQLGIPFVQG
jgi:large subunit ribosomal protein L5